MRTQTFIFAEFMLCSLMHPTVEMTQRQIEARSFPEQPLSSSRPSVSSMICEQAYWSPTPSEERPLTWTNTQDSLGQHGYLLMCVISTILEQ